MFLTSWYDTPPKDPEACMQVLGATHKSLSGRSGRGSDDGGRRQLLVDSISSALRTDMLRSLKATYALSDVTQVCNTVNP